MEREEDGYMARAGGEIYNPLHVRRSVIARGAALVASLSVMSLSLIRWVRRPSKS